MLKYIIIFMSVFWGVSRTQSILSPEQKAALYFWLELYQKDDPILKRGALRALLACRTEFLEEMEKRVGSDPAYASLWEALKKPQAILLEDLQKEANPDLKTLLYRHLHQKEILQVSIQHRKISGLPPLSTPLYLDLSLLKSSKELELILSEKMALFFQQSSLYPLAPLEKAEFCVLPQIFRPKVSSRTLDGELYWLGELQLQMVFCTLDKQKRLKDLNVSAEIKQKQKESSPQQVLERLIEQSLIQVSECLEPQIWTLEIPVMKGIQNKYERGIYFLMAQQLDAALSFFKQIPAEERDAEFFFNLGVTYESQEKISEALKAYQQALRLSPEIQEYQKAVLRCQSLLFQ
ncbi:MAG: tetratricopeptide repeat protein [Planctomycetota bacterium]